MLCQKGFHFLYNPIRHFATFCCAHPLPISLCLYRRHISAYRPGCRGMLVKPQLKYFRTWTTAVVFTPQQSYLRTNMSQNCVCDHGLFEQVFLTGMHAKTCVSSKVVCPVFAALQASHKRRMHSCACSERQQRSSNMAEKPCGF